MFSFMADRFKAIIITILMISSVAYAQNLNYGDFSGTVPAGYKVIDTGDPDYRIYLEGAPDNGYIPLINITEYSSIPSRNKFSDMLIRELPGIVANWRFVARDNVKNRYGVEAVRIRSTSNQSGDDITHTIYNVESAKGDRVYMITCTNLKSNGRSQEQACLDFFDAFVPL